MAALAKYFPALQKTSTRFHGLPKRDQLALKVLTLGIIIFMAFIFVWQPVQAFKESSKAASEQAYQDLVWMKENQAAARIAGRQQQGNQQRPVSAQSLLSTVSASAQRFSIDLQRFEPRGDSKVNVWLDRVPFDQMMLWLSDINQKNNIVVEQMTVDKTDQPGQVSARLSLSI